MIVMIETDKYKNRLTTLIIRNPLVWFFVLACAISWISFVPIILVEWKIIEIADSSLYAAIFSVHTFGPALAAYFVLRLTEGKSGWTKIRERVRKVRFGWRQYLFIMILVPAFMLAGILLMPGSITSFQGLPQHFLVRYLFLFVLIFFGGGPLGEELGWRGFAYPRMQTRYGPLKAALLLGIVWTFWHLADFFTSSQKGGPGTGLFAFTHQLPVFLVQVVALSVIFAWVYNVTKGSLFAAILLHASYDTFGSTVQPLFQNHWVTSTDFPFAIPMMLLAVALIIGTKGRLGFEKKRNDGSKTGMVEESR